VRRHGVWCLVLAGFVVGGDCLVCMESGEIPEGAAQYYLFRLSRRAGTSGKHIVSLLQMRTNERSPFVARPVDPTYTTPLGGTTEKGLLCHFQFPSNSPDAVRHCWVPGTGTGVLRVSHLFCSVTAGAVPPAWRGPVRGARHEVRRARPFPSIDPGSFAPIRPLSRRPGEIHLNTYGIMAPRRLPHAFSHPTSHQAPGSHGINLHRRSERVHGRPPLR
jgi:hypothetical protein